MYPLEVIERRLESIEKKLDQLLAKRKSNGAKAKSAAAEHDEAIAAFVAPEWMAVDGEYVELFMGYCDWRRSKRKYVTQNAIDMMLKKWRDYSPAAIKNALRDSIANGWIGVFPESDNGAEQVGADWFGGD